MKRFNLRHFAVFIAFIGIATLINLFLYTFGAHEANLTMIYLLAVLLIAIYTQSYSYSVITPFMVVLLFNFFFTEPRFTFSIYDPQYPLTFFIMLAIALITSTLTVKLKAQKEYSQNILRQKQASDIKAHTEKIRSNILRSISHDLRTPLTTISGGIETVMNTKHLSETKKDALLEDIYDETQWLMRLIENILNLTKIQEGRINLQKDYESIDDILTEPVKRVKGIVGKRKIKVNLPEEMLVVALDINLIVQVFINLIENSVKNSDDHTNIVLTARKKGSTIEFSVTDEGQPIDAKDVEHIFKVFYTSKHDGSRGIGLGLSICKAIIELHDGTIWYERTENGNRFLFNIPMKEDEADE